MLHNPLIVIQLNEINFELVSQYVQKYSDLTAFKKILENYQYFETFGEDEYYHLEPWIQWVSAQTGKTYSQHGVFRLGDIVKAPEEVEQIFEVLERSGLRVGAISPMNARNRLSSPAYFVPDPWTETESDGAGFSRRVAHMLHQTVNDNSTGRISTKSLLTLAETTVFSFHLIGTVRLFKYVATAISSPWYKSLVLDHLIHLLHRQLLSKYAPDVSFVFFNAGAHIQHHYMLNSEMISSQSSNPEWYIPSSADPFHDMLKVYNHILEDYLKLEERGARLLIATGLSQIPYDRVKFYHRLKDHAQFLKLVGIDASHVAPRMTRDFEVSLVDEQSAKDAASLLSSLTMARDGVALFGDIDVRTNTIFASLTYPHEILPDDSIVLPDGRRLHGFHDMVAFVAIKNGMHSKKGYGYLSPNVKLIQQFKKPFHIARLFDLTLSAAHQ